MSDTVGVQSHQCWLRTIVNYASFHYMFINFLYGLMGSFLCNMNASKE